MTVYVLKDDLKALCGYRPPGASGKAGMSGP